MKSNQAKNRACSPGFLEFYGARALQVIRFCARSSAVGFATEFSFSVSPPFLFK